MLSVQLGAIISISTGVVLALLLARVVRLGKSPSDKSIALLFNNRVPYDDAAFYDKFYGKSDIPPDVPLRLRRLFERVFGDSMLRLEPSDNVFEFYNGVDPMDICRAIKREFGLVAPIRAFAGTDWSFDALVRCIVQNKSAS